MHFLFLCLLQFLLNSKSIFEIKFACEPLISSCTFTHSGQSHLLHLGQNFPSVEWELHCPKLKVLFSHEFKRSDNLIF